MRMSVLPLLTLLLLLLGGVLCSKLTIRSANEFIEFSNNVNSGTNYSGTTVFLDSDIDFSGKAFEPIGNETNCFLGTFDGQGHKISNLKIRSSLKFVGLFGYSQGSIIKNFVMDSSCSVVNSYESDSYVANTGGIIGECFSNFSQSGIENVVNMASVTFNGNIRQGTLNLGGIAGEFDMFHSSKYEPKIKNCVNYGTVTHMGISNDACVGGIAGAAQGTYTHKTVVIQNCLNYGTISNNNTLYIMNQIGGIVGDSNYATIENCVGAGNVLSSRKCDSIGILIGYISYSDAFYCYWDKELPQNPIMYSGGYSSVSYTSFNGTTFELNESVSVLDYTGTSLLDALNTVVDHYYLRDYSRWTLNREENDVSFKTNNNKGFTLSSPIILLPNIISEGHLSFDGWYTNEACTAKFTGDEFTSKTNLYGKRGENTNSYTITFDTKGGTPALEPLTAQFGTAFSLPNDISRDNCEFVWWENDYDDPMPWNFAVPARNLTLHAVWSCTVISSAADLVDFSKVVNSGTNNFTGKTVSIGSDIVFTDELSRKFNPIGKSKINHIYYFLGKFDGQGHVISNLKINSYTEDVGLFGYSESLLITNIVMDSSCSITSSYEDLMRKEIRTGSVLGKCHTQRDICGVQNTVSMASVTFKGNTKGFNIYVGGITGYISSDSTDYSAFVINCANYGPVTNIGASGAAVIGGIAGYHSGKVYVSTSQNNLNYGTITNNDTLALIQYIGGIIGDTKYIAIENCLSAGKIIFNMTYKTYVGGIGGSVYPSSSSKTPYIGYSVWTSDVGCENIVNGTKNLIKKSYLVTSLNDTTIRELNDIPDGKDSLSRWAMLHLNGGNINDLPQETPISGLLRNLPIPVKEGYKFSYWCTDEDCYEQFDPQTTNESAVTELYARWDISSYKLTFDFRNGTVYSVMLHFNDIIEYPKVGEEREGFTFIGWSPKPERMPAHDITIKAQWNVTKSTEYVEIVFGRDLSEEEIKDIVGKYVPEGEEITIEKYEKNESGGVTAIIKFTDKVKAINFVETVSALSEGARDSIKAIKIADSTKSFTPSLGLLVSAYYFL